MSLNNTADKSESPGLVPFNYQCRGSDMLLPNNIHAYYVSPSGLAPASMGIVIIHDIFGFKINKVRRYADILAAKTNANVLLPDFFQGGDPWPLDDYPAKDEKKFNEWFKKISDWEYIAQVLATSNDYLKTILSEEHRNSLGVLGFSWGGKQVMRACSSAEYGYLAGVSIDGLNLDAEDADKLNIPVFFMNSGDNKSMDTIKSCLKKRSFGDRCRNFTFGDEHHGFASALGDLNNQNTLEAVNHTITLSSAFFIENARDAEKAEKEKNEKEKVPSNESSGSKELISSGLNIARSS